MLGVPLLMLGGLSLLSGGDRLRPWDADPRYWQYKGRPVLLVGGSREDNLFQIPDLKEHLDLLAAVGGNYIRNTMSDRDEGNVYAFARRPDGKYDLDQWHDEYWRRFANLLQWTEERDIIVQIEVWDRFDYTDNRGANLWQRSPWNPANNITYTATETGFAARYPNHPSSDDHPFFHTVPGMTKYQPRYDVIRRVQERYVERLLELSLPRGNVLYCMNNETSTEAAWGLYWMRFIRQRAAAAGVDVYVTDMFDDAWQSETSTKLRFALDRPEDYQFIDISQVNSRNFGEDHWRRIQWVVQQVKAHPRPVNHTKIYSAGQTSFGSGTPQDGLERMWRNLLAGSASSRFHRPTSGIGLNELSQACLKSVRLVESRVKFWELEPAQELLGEREPNEAYLAAAPGRAYVLFFCLGGRVSLDLTAAPGPFELRWIDVARGDWGPTAEVPGGQRASLVAPGEGAWVAVLTATLGG